MTSVVREHEWYTVPGIYGGQRCNHCNSSTGIGFYSIVTCNLRFNEKGFKQYLEFNNMSITKDGNHVVKRFTSEQMPLQEVKDKFLSLCDKEEDEKVKKQKIYVTENAT